MFIGGEEKNGQRTAVKNFFRRQRVMTVRDVPFRHASTSCFQRHFYQRAEKRPRPLREGRAPEPLSPRGTGQFRGRSSAWSGNVVVIAFSRRGKGSSLNAPVPLQEPERAIASSARILERAKEEGVGAALEIDLALWGMIACLAMKVAEHSF